jgi:hypothetical protein
MERAVRWVLACLTAGVAWAVVEVGGGMLFLAMGLRLWRYEIVPIWADITSPVVWCFAAAFIVPLSAPVDRVMTAKYGEKGGLCAHLAFIMAVGPVLEVVFNDFIFRKYFGHPLYLYTFLPTFDGSGSLLSPLYYGTLLIHRPICSWILGHDRGASAAAASLRSAHPAT